ncbi:hypothetical protein MSG28_012106 [Choristoneura fumiferana]|uniref:Uncharacterized protein n=1 Tax=Choristoneura fumiferana TaxID=7141 RepID=A0ACC0KC55_CHOFU|nr:hypothetical protein MSG28_012106 [Choristoneura fumiferana]
MRSSGKWVIGTDLPYEDVSLAHDLSTFLILFVFQRACGIHECFSTSTLYLSLVVAPSAATVLNRCQVRGKECCVSRGHRLAGGEQAAVDLRGRAVHVMLFRPYPQASRSHDPTSCRASRSGPGFWGILVTDPRVKSQMQIK